MNHNTLNALSKAAHAKGSPLNDKEREAVLAANPEPIPVPVGPTTFTFKTIELVQAQDAGFVHHVETHDSGIIADLASRPPERYPFSVQHEQDIIPIRVRLRDLKVVDSLHRLLAAKARGKATVLCEPCTVQENLSF